MSVLSGKVSWFGGPNDPTAQGKPASGLPITFPGIAVNNPATLGGWWAVKAPNGAIGIIRQTDLGPATWTHKTFDFTYSALPLFGYTQQNFPTGSQASGVYLGKTLADVSTTAHAALLQLGATDQQVVGMMQTVDAGAVERGHSVVLDPSGKQVAAPGVSTTSGSEAVGAGINLPNPLSGLEAIAAFVTSPTNWLRIGEVIAGLVLIAMGLRTLSGSTTTPATVVRAAVK